MYRYINATSVGYGVEQAIKALNQYGTIEERENQDKMDTLKEIQLILDIDDVNAEPAISRCVFTDIKGLASYDHEMLDGTADNKGWEYTYHELYAPYYDNVITELKRNPQTRRARITLGASRPEIIYSGDPPCLIELLFKIVAGKLEMTILFRSNDGVKAFPMNIHALAMLQRKVAKELDIVPGAMHYIADNFHCYSRDFEILEQYCKNFESAPMKRRFWSYEDIEKVM